MASRIASSCDGDVEAVGSVLNPQSIVASDYGLGVVGSRRNGNLKYRINAEEGATLTPVPAKLQ